MTINQIKCCSMLRVICDVLELTSLRHHTASTAQATTQATRAHRAVQCPQYCTWLVIRCSHSPCLSIILMTGKTWTHTTSHSLNMLMLAVKKAKLINIRHATAIAIPGCYGGVSYYTLTIYLLIIILFRKTFLDYM